MNFIQKHKSEEAGGERIEEKNWSDGRVELYDLEYLIRRKYMIFDHHKISTTKNIGTRPTLNPSKIPISNTMMGLNFGVSVAS